MANNNLKITEFSGNVTSPASTNLVVQAGTSGILYIKDAGGTIRIRVLAAGGITFYSALVPGASLDIGQTANKWRDLYLSRDAFCAGTVVSGDSGVGRGQLIGYHGAGGNTPGAVKLYADGGTPWWLWVTDAGQLRIHSALPTADTDGNPV